MKNILMTAFHYPPVKGSSGVHRTLSFSRYLPEYGFNPIILTVKKKVYDRVDNELMHNVPKNIVVSRATAFDAARDFSIRNFYPLLFALPDRWQSWILSGVVQGLKLIRQYRPQVIWSTYPIATAHMIALILNRLTGIPWVADFRDSMTEAHYPNNKIVWRTYRWIEKHTIKNAIISVFTAPGAKTMYLNRYGKKFSEKFKIIENGVDEEIFREIPATSKSKENNHKPPYKLIHSGILYQEERNPTFFFSAIKALKETNEINAKVLKIILRASGNETEYQKILEKHQIADIIELAPPCHYQEALSEMINADGLLLFQGSSCNHQIPAKVYEYLKTGRPVIGLTDTRGDTFSVLKNAGHSYFADLSSTEDIKNCLVQVLNDFDNNMVQTDCFITDQYDRKNRTQELSRILDKVIL